MVAVRASSTVILGIIRESELMQGLELACHNSNDNCVISGQIKELDVLERVCKLTSIKTKRMDVPYGFHSASLGAIMERLGETCSSITWSQPAVPVASTMLGKMLNTEDCGSDYFSRHARQTVLFTQAIGSLYSEANIDGSICLEIGPHPITVSGIPVRDHATVLYDDRAPDEDAHTCYAVDHQQGAIVVIRPDLWIGQSLPLAKAKELGVYFDEWLNPVGAM